MRLLSTIFKQRFSSAHYRRLSHMSVVRNNKKLTQHFQQFYWNSPQLSHTTNDLQTCRSWPISSINMHETQPNDKQHPITSDQHKDPYKPLEAFYEKNIPIINQELNKYLSFNLEDPRQILERAMQYSVFGKSKRIRPLLTIASQQLFNQPIDKILPLACSIELVHTYSLIHDDLPAMDNDDFRRGQPSCHKQFGEDIAILTGDTLHALAFEILAKTLPQLYSSDKVVEIIWHMSKAFGINGMAGGQVLDLKNTSQFPQEKYVKTTHRLKTGEMLKMCIILPPYLQTQKKKISSR